MNRKTTPRRRIALSGVSWRVLLEAWGLAILALCLIFFVIDDLPPNNIPTAFLFLLQVPVGWAALRLKIPSRPFTWKAVGREVLFAVGLQGIVLVTAYVLARAFQSPGSIRWDTTAFPSASLVLAMCAAFYLVYRLLIGLVLAWRRRAETKLLWMMVSTHLVTVFTLIILVSAVSRIGTLNSGVEPYRPSGVLANVVLEFVRSVAPWVGFSILLALAAMVVLFLPTLLVSYLTARPLVRRISELTVAMKKLRQSDLSARAAPSGQDEIAQLQDDFNHMAAELQQEHEKMAALLQNQRELAAIISHELRTPVTVMRAYIEDDLYENPEPLPESYRADIETIHHETLKLQGLIEDLFTLSQLDANQLELTCRWVDGVNIITRVATSLKKVAWDPKRIELCMQLPPDLPEIWADESRLEQVLSNLVQNAVRHTTLGGVILLQAQPDGDWLVIEVLDTGEGIASQDLPHLFERFYRGKQGGGAGRIGIGLALVKELVENMGGSVGVESQPSEGSRFWLRLKARTRQQASPA